MLFQREMLVTGLMAGRPLVKAMGEPLSRGSWNREIFLEVKPLVNWGLGVGEEILL